MGFNNNDILFVINYTLISYAGMIFFFFASFCRLRIGLVMDKIVWRERFSSRFIVCWTVVTIWLRDMPVKSLMLISLEPSSFNTLPSSRLSVPLISVTSICLREGRVEVPGYWADSASLRALHIPFRCEDPNVSWTTSVGEREASGREICSSRSSGGNTLSVVYIQHYPLDQIHCVHNYMYVSLTQCLINSWLSLLRNCFQEQSNCCIEQQK